MTNNNEKSFIEKHQLLSGLVGAILSCIITLIGGSVFVSKNYVSADSFDVLMNTYFVTPGLVSKEVIGSEPNEQFQIIADTMSTNKIELENYKNILTDIIIGIGMDESALETITAESVLNEMSTHEDQLQRNIAELSKQIDSLKSDIVSLQNENKELHSQTVAKIQAATLIVDGEQIDENIPNSVADVDGHLYYSESLLNTFLSEPISFDFSKSTVFFGTERAEKIVFPASMITQSDFAVYAVGSGNSFVMGTDTYDNGFVKRYGNSKRLYANLKGKYSKMSFTVGHIDGTASENVTLYIYAKNGNDKYRLLKTYELTYEMFPEEKTVELNYADGLQIVIEGSYSAEYALADIYLYR